MAGAPAVRNARGLPAGYYAWRDRPASAQQQRRDALLVEIRAVHAEVKARYGSPRIHAELEARGQDCCVNTVAKLMQDNGIRAKTARKFRNTTDSNHDLPVADNLLDRQFDPGVPERVVGGRHHLHPDARGLAVPRRRRGSVLPAGGGLVDGRPHGEPPGRRCPGDGRRSGACPARGCWHTPTAAASTPATITNASWPGTASRAA